jgi:hypothetical protein
MSTLLQFLVYPGALWVIGFAMLILFAFGGATHPRRWLSAVRRSSVAWQLSMVLAAVTIALLPWPNSSFAPSFSFDLWRTWVFSEASISIALLPGLAATDQATHTATVHKAQVAVAGRMALWVAVLAGFGNDAIGALAVAYGAALLALPFAAGWLVQGQIQRDHMAQSIRSVLSIALVASFLVNTPALALWQQLALRLGAAMVLAVWRRWLCHKRLRLRTETALRVCFFGALPLAILALAAR